MNPQHKQTPDLPILPAQVQLPQIRLPFHHFMLMFHLPPKVLSIFQDFRIPLFVFATTDAQSMPQPLHALPLPLVYTAASLQSSARAHKHTNLLLMTKQHWHASSTAPDSRVSQCKHMHMHQSIRADVSRHAIL